MEEKSSRNQLIYDLYKNRKLSYSQIAKKFSISIRRVQQICSKIKSMEHERSMANTFRYSISKRLQNLISKNLGEDYLDNPEKFEFYDLKKMFAYRTFGKMLCIELIEKLEKFGIIIENHDEIINFNKRLVKNNIALAKARLSSK